jgi:alkanesulfonate monooxygenase SsuD/methylene tetrahydromethanopterin reductase-like flavin-dependent oxidoreductase (luciferase family)
MRMLWTQDEPRFEGDHIRLDGSFELIPRPSRPGGPPIVIGGHSLAAARRAARRGDGFFPSSPDPEVLPPLYDLVRAEAQRLGRSADAIELIGVTSRQAGWTSRLADMGVTHAVLPSGRPDLDIEGLKARLGAFSEKVIERHS